MHTRQQKKAQIAFKCISEAKISDRKTYLNFAKKFPVLVHNCGLAQSIAYINKNNSDDKISTYLKHLSSVMSLKENDNLLKKSRNVELIEYQQLSKEATEAATWIKRYAEILLEADES